MKLSEPQRKALAYIAGCHHVSHAAFVRRGGAKDNTIGSLEDMGLIARDSRYIIGYKITDKGLALVEEA